ncbi:MAG: hypothetical protein AAFZ35_16920 [Cyanobacteria bacterium J06649_12]
MHTLTEATIKPASIDDSCAVSDEINEGYDIVTWGLTNEVILEEDLQYQKRADIVADLVAAHLRLPGRGLIIYNSNGSIAGTVAA